MTVFKPLIPKSFRRSCFGGYVRKTDGEHFHPLRYRKTKDGSIVTSVDYSKCKEHES